MRTKPAALLTLFLGAIFSVGCSKDEAPQVAATTATPEAATAATAAPEQKQRASACDLVTASEMSAILGGTVTAAAGGNERPPTSTECIYSSVAGSDDEVGLASVAGPNPYAELAVDWGAGDPEAMGTATDLINSAAPIGAVDPLQGLGERAYQVTADQVFISSKGDLIMIRFPRRSVDVAPKARRIYETAKPRM
jgi:hypothetical protein